MSYERTPNSLLIAELQAEKIDEVLSADYHNALDITQGCVSFLEYLKPDPETFELAKRTAVESGDPVDYDAIVNVGPPNPPPEQYVIQETEFLKIRTKLKRDGKSGYESPNAASTQITVNQLYLWRINELVGQTRLMQAIYDGDSSRINRWNEFIYGKPDPEIHAAVIVYFRNRAEEMLCNNESRVSEAAETVLSLLPTAMPTIKLFEPSQKIFQKIRNEHFKDFGYYPLLFSDIELPEKGPVKPDTGEPILRQVMENVGIGIYAREEANSAWEVDNTRQTVQGPQEYSMPLKRFIGLPAGHEIGSHGLEYTNGSRQILGLLAHGLDRYDRGNEGRAVIREQVPYESFEGFTKTNRWEDILRRHMATGFLAGLWPDGTIAKDFITALTANDIIFEASQPQQRPVNEVMERAEKRTWKLVERVIGRKIYKDAYYLEGNIASWKAYDIIADGDLGKFDISNQRHISGLRELGIL